jgi:hypothetical protein
VLQAAQAQSVELRSVPKSASAVAKTKLSPEDAKLFDEMIHSARSTTFACTKFDLASQLRCENSRQTKSLGRLVDPMRGRLSRTRVLRIGICF